MFCKLFLKIYKELLKKGENEITVFESDGIKGEPVVEFTDKPILG